MNKYSLKAHLQKELSPFASTLKATSFDSANQEHLCQDEYTSEVYDFDTYVKERQPHPTPASPDAICLGHKAFYFIEFKNQYAASVDKQQLRQKFLSGTEILKALLDGFSPKDCQYHFCVVLKKQEKPRYMDFRHIENNGVRFDLDRINHAHGNFYDHIITESLDFYIKTFKQLQC